LAYQFGFAGSQGSHWATGVYDFKGIFGVSLSAVSGSLNGTRRADLFGSFPRLLM